MKIEKITDAFVNEFDAQAQSCYDDCNEYRGSARANIEEQIKGGREYWGFDIDEYKDITANGDLYCYRDKTPKTCIYW